jgi:hypothetical protein
VTDTAKKLDPSKGGTSIGGMIDPGGAFIKEFTGSDIGRQIADPAGLIPGDPTAAGVEQRKKATESIAKQKKKEQTLLKQAKSEIKEKKAVATRSTSGRSLLIATSPTGLANLGGT